jgi:hypothetical protein
MTEAEWLACGDARAMVSYLGKQVSDRKLRHFVFACVRRLWHRVPAGPLRHAIEASERHADGLIDQQELGAAITAANRARPSRNHVARAAYDAARFSGPGLVHWDSVTINLAAAAADDAVWFLPPTAYTYFAEGRTVTVDVPMNPARRKWNARRDGEYAAQCDLIREILGNPFRPVTLDQAWLTPDVVSLARTIYHERTFDRMPEVADALARSGCTDADILAHCRRPVRHVRGCWVVDLLLGNE